MLTHHTLEYAKCRSEVTNVVPAGTRSPTTTK